MKHQLAQLNIARLLAPIDSPVLAEFVANLASINRLADEAEGFVWRLQTEDGDATAIDDFGDDYLVNMSVWTDIASLHNFVYRSAHINIMVKRKSWFSRMDDAYSVLWWVPEGHKPSMEEARAKLELLRSQGPGPEAFTFRQPYESPLTAGEALKSAPFDDLCAAT